MICPKDWNGASCGSCGHHIVLRVGTVSDTAKVWIGCENCKSGNLYRVNFIPSSDEKVLAIASLNIENEVGTLTNWTEGEN